MLMQGPGIVACNPLLRTANLNRRSYKATLNINILTPADP